MFIPTGVNHAEFYKAAKQKGIHVKSRFIGVVISVNGGKPYWAAQYQEAGKKILFKRFPFTEQGEIDANKKYLAFIDRTGKQKRRNVKPEFKNK